MMCGHTYFLALVYMSYLFLTLLALDVHAP